MYIYKGRAKLHRRETAIGRLPNPGMGKGTEEELDLGELLQREENVVAHAMRFVASTGHFVLHDKRIPCLDAIHGLGRFVLACVMLDIFRVHVLEETCFQNANIAVYRWSRILYDSTEAMTREHVFTWFMYFFWWEAAWRLFGVGCMVYNALRFSNKAHLYWLRLFFDRYGGDINVSKSDKDNIPIASDIDDILTAISVAMQRRLHGGTVHEASYTTKPWTNEATVAELTNDLLTLEWAQTDKGKGWYIELKAFAERIKSTCQVITTVVALVLLALLVFLLFVLLPVAESAEDHLYFLKDNLQSLTLVYLIFSACLLLASLDLGGRIVSFRIFLAVYPPHQNKNQAEDPREKENNSDQDEGRQDEDKQDEDKQDEDKQGKTEQKEPEINMCYLCCTRCCEWCWKGIKRLFNCRCISCRKWGLWLFEAVLWVIVAAVCVSHEVYKDILLSECKEGTEDQPHGCKERHICADLKLRKRTWDPSELTYDISLVLVMIAVAIRAVGYTMQNNLLGKNFKLDIRVRVAFWLELSLQFAVVFSGLYIARDFLKNTVKTHQNVYDPFCDPNESTNALAFWLTREQLLGSSTVHTTAFIGSLSSDAFLLLNATDTVQADDYASVMHLCFWRGSGSTIIGEHTDTSYSVYLIAVLYLFFSGLIGATFGVLTVVWTCLEKNSNAIDYVHVFPKKKARGDASKNDLESVPLVPEKGSVQFPPGYPGNHLATNSRFPEMDEHNHHQQPLEELEELQEPPPEPLQELEEPPPEPLQEPSQEPPEEPQPGPMEAPEDFDTVEVQGGDCSDEEV